MEHMKLLEADGQVIRVLTAIRSSRSTRRWLAQETG